MTSTPVIRTIKVLELFAQSDKPETLATISRKCGIPMATASRIVGTLESEGYLHRSRDKMYYRNFSLQKKMNLSEGYLSCLEQVLEDVSELSEQSSEAIFIENSQLHWLSKKESKNVAFRLKAYPGFKRPLYELDSPSRLSLAAMGWDKVREQFDVNAFFETGMEREKVSKASLKARLQNTCLTDVVYDVEGNIRGIRRFSKAIFDRHGQFVHLLCIAEAAISKHDIQSHIESNKKIINEAAAKLTAFLHRE
ncbi:helix-turn-helix domain-containing protein [Marinomonas spartinae]|uniref:helix-turn-helix domain-containing protein n=1 Tax=Marinomonas spartinae TaxID=1792290 RepID=UPI0018F1447A|nr:helix-turn-helix domain-containing protein [Marinomonas spartinae]MBJ7556605.1 helix-turn-helix domain-containing protein [Marinomonas spartinae]